MGAGRYQRLPLLVLLAAACVLTRVAFAVGFPPFFDEALFAAMANTAAHDASQAFIMLADLKGPLQTWLAVPLIKAGVDPLWAVRILSIAAGVVTMLAVVDIGTQLRGRAAGVAAGVAYTFLPYALVHDGIGIVDPLVSAGVTVALALQIRLARRPSLGTAIGLGVALGLALLAKRTSWYAVMLLPLSLLVVARLDRDHVRRWLGFAALSVLTAVGLYSIQRFSWLWSQQAAIGRLAGLYTSPADVLRHPLAGLPFAKWYWRGFTGYVTLPLLLLAVAGLVAVAAEWGKRFLLICAWLVVPIVIGIEFPNYPAPRYVLTAVPIVAVLLGVGAMALVELARQRRPGRAAPALAAGVLVLAAAPALAKDVGLWTDPTGVHYAGQDDAQYRLSWTSGIGTAAIAGLLRDHAPEGTTVIGSASWPSWHVQVELGDPIMDRDLRQLAVSSRSTVVAGRKRFEFVDARSDAVRGARYIVRDERYPLIVPQDESGWVRVARVKRPGAHSTALEIWARAPG